MAAPMSCTSRSVFCFILRNFAFAGKSLTPPYGPWEHVPPHVFCREGVQCNVVYSGGLSMRG